MDYGGGIYYFGASSFIYSFLGGGGFNFGNGFIQGDLIFKFIKQHLLAWLILYCLTVWIILKNQSNNISRKTCREKHNYRKERIKKNRTLWEDF